VSVEIHLEIPPETPRSALLGALGLEDDHGAVPAHLPIELGRAATGSTAILVPDDVPGRFSLTVPLVRAPWSGPELLPSIAAAAASLGGRLDPPDALAQWTAARAYALRELAALCESQGAPLPPFLPRAHLDALHQWLLAIDHAPPGPALSHTVFCLDPRDGGPVRLAVRLPRAAETTRARLPPVGGVLADLDELRTPEAPALFSIEVLAAFGRDAHGFVDVDVAEARAALRAAAARGEGEQLSQARFVSPVEIIDLEGLAG
jgi:hypothetical protein